MYVFLDFHFVLELDFLVSSTGLFYFITAVTGRLVNELYLASTKGSEDTALGACLLFCRSVGMECLKKTPIFVVLPNYTEDEPMFRDTLRTSALVFIAESDPLLRHAGAFRVRLGWLRGFGRQHQASSGSLRLSRIEYKSGSR